MIPEKLQEIMKKDGVVAIATLGLMAPHGKYLNSYSEYRKMNGCLFPQVTCTRRRPTLPTSGCFDYIGEQ